MILMQDEFQCVLLVEVWQLISPQDILALPDFSTIGATLEDVQVSKAIGI